MTPEPQDARSLFDVTDQRVLVTGSGTGLGACIAKAFGAYGAKVAVAGRSRESLDHTVEQIRSAGGRALAVPFDARSRSSCEALINATVSEFGGLDIAVINHGIGHGKAAESVNDSEWQDVMDTNLNGYFRCSQLAGMQMLGQGTGGSIVIVGSTAGVVAFPNLLAYSTSKAAALQLARQLAVEWGDRGIRVNAVCPGYMTHMMKGTGDRYAGADVDDWVTRMTPLRRRGESHELVGAVIFLSSAAASFVTGQVISVDGGYTLV